MGMIADLQAEHKKWAQRNFPDQTPTQMVLGITEEVGELAHAQLKHEQKIRGFDDPVKYGEAVSDALGDIFIYAMSFCNVAGFDLETCILTAWQGVQQRDWVANPQNAHELSDAEAAAEDATWD